MASCGGAKSCGRTPLCCCRGAPCAFRHTWGYLGIRTRVPGYAFRVVYAMCKHSSLNASCGAHPAPVRPGMQKKETLNMNVPPQT
eukprot:1456755-Rhodomonas_salina.1